MSQNYKDHIEEIMKFVYHYDLSVAWCKAVSIDVLTTKWLNEEEQEGMNSYINMPDAIETHIRLRDCFLKKLKYCTPETTPYYDLLDGYWELAEHKAHEIVLHQMISKSIKEIKERQHYNRNEISCLLSRLNIKTLDGLYAKDPLIKKQVNDFFKSETVSYDYNGKSIINFEDYSYLQKLFLGQLFDIKHTRFFINNTPEGLDDVAPVSAIIGVDRNIICMIWLDD
ncbi:hypothetical protein [Aquimarina longa]|uniref:hypothetical protein n=1 Tax=Aquimarina longa TaxID=1080221 RepID=UPI0007853C3C|nr:hypothetical protein [Aquimarina longa]